MARRLPRARSSGLAGRLLNAALLVLVGLGAGRVLADLLPRIQAGVLRGHAGAVTGVVLTRDGQTVISGSRDDTVRFWRVSDGSLTRTLQVGSAGVTALALSPDGTALAAGGNDGTVRIWPVAGGPLQATLPGQGAVAGLAFSADGRRVFSAAGETVRSWTVADGQPGSVIQPGFGNGGGGGGKHTDRRPRRARRDGHATGKQPADSGRTGPRASREGETNRDSSGGGTDSHARSGSDDHR